MDTMVQPGSGAHAASGAPAVTFVLPGDGRSGGVRVTVIMANLLLDRGYRVRIAHCLPPRSLRGAVASLRRWLHWARRSDSGFLHLFRGPKEPFRALGRLRFESGEVVIAVGTYSVAAVRDLEARVRKVRFNHGFPARPTGADEAAWRGRMTTITVSRTLVPRLQELTEGSVWGVVPNGIETREYFVDASATRTGIGALFSRHPNKAPEDLVAVLREAHRRWPGTPQYVFGTEKCPGGLEHATYTQLPPVAEARAIYNRCKVWVLTSRTEGLPGVVLEAMACGCAVVSTDNDGSLEILRHESNGLIAPRGDRVAVVEQIGRALEDNVLRAHLCEGAAATIREYTWSRAADRMEEFLGWVQSTPCQ